MRIIYLVCIACTIIINSSDMTQTLQSLYRSIEQLYTAVDPIAANFDELLRHPEAISLRNHKIFKQLNEKLKPFQIAESRLISPEGRKEYEQQADAILKESVQEHPLSCFFECNDPSCPLARQNNPSYRDQFDKQVAQRIVAAEQEKTEDQPVIYTSIASGGLFQDLRILGLALSQKDDLKLEIHMVDPWFTQHRPRTTLSYNKFAKLSPEADVTGKTLRYPPAIRPNNTPIYQTTFGKYPINQPAYMLHILQYMYPKANITLYIYEKMEIYMQFIWGLTKQPSAGIQPKYVTKIQTPDIIAVSDIDDYITVSNISEQVLELLKGNQNALAIYLMALKEKQATLTEFSRSFVSDGKKYAFANMLNIIGGYDPDPGRTNNIVQANIQLLG